MPTDLVQEGLTDVTDVTDAKPWDVTVAESILTSVGTPRLNPPGDWMGAEALLDLNFQGKSSSWASSPPKFRLRRA